MRKIFLYGCLLLIFMIVVVIVFALNSTANDMAIKKPKIQLSLAEVIPKKKITVFYYAENGSIFRKTAFEKPVLLKEKIDNGVFRENNEYYSNVIFFDGWIYYIAHKNQFSNFTLCRMNSAGREISELVPYVMFDSDESFNSLFFYDGKIYIQTNFKFYRYDTREGSFEKLLDDVGIYQIYNHQLYFIDHANRTFTIYQMDLQTLETKILLGTGRTAVKETGDTLYSNILFVGDHLYYTTRIPDGLYRYVNGEKDVLIHGGESEYSLCEYELFEYSQKLCYILRSSDKVYHCMQYDPETGSISELATFEDFASEPRIDADIFYYRDSSKQERSVPIYK